MEQQDSYANEDDELNQTDDEENEFTEFVFDITNENDQFIRKCSTGIFDDFIFGEYKYSFIIPGDRAINFCKNKIKKTPE